MKTSSIINALTSQVASTLGSDWSELKYIYDLERNDGQTIKQAYGVGVSGRATVTGRTKAVTYDQEFFVILTKRHSNRGSDSSERQAVNDLYDAVEDIDAAIFQKKLGIADTVLSVQDISTDEVETVDDKTVSLRTSYIIKFRNDNF